MPILQESPNRSLHTDPVAALQNCDNPVIKAFGDKIAAAHLSRSDGHLDCKIGDRYYSLDRLNNGEVWINSSQVHLCLVPSNNGSKTSWSPKSDQPLLSSYLENLSKESKNIVRQVGIESDTVLNIEKWISKDGAVLPIGQRAEKKINSLESVEFANDEKGKILIYTVSAEAGSYSTTVLRFDENYRFKSATKTVVAEAIVQDSKFISTPAAAQLVDYLKNVSETGLSRTSPSTANLIEDARRSKG